MRTPRTARVRPAVEGTLVPLPGKISRHLPATGMVVALSAYWKRRLANGEIVIVQETKSESAPAVERRGRARAEE